MTENYRESGQKSWSRTNNMTYDRTWAKQAMILQHLERMIKRSLNAMAIFSTIEKFHLHSCIDFLLFLVRLDEVTLVGYGKIVCLDCVERLMNFEHGFVNKIMFLIHQCQSPLQITIVNKAIILPTWMFGRQYELALRKLERNTVSCRLCTE